MFSFRERLTTHTVTALTLGWGGLAACRALTALASWGGGVLQACNRAECRLVHAEKGRGTGGHRVCFKVDDVIRFWIRWW